MATVFIFTCSGLFQALDNTWPSLASTAMRIVTFVVPLVWVSQWQGFEIEHVWMLSVASVMVQAVIDFLLLRREFERKLVPAAVTPAPGPATVPGQA